MKYMLGVLSFFALFAILSGFGESFRNPFRIATEVDPDGILVADLNGDGRPDLMWTARGARATDPSTVHVLLAKPDGTYAAPLVRNLPADVTPFCQVADETRDGKPDLICPDANQFSASLMVFPGKGDGTFGDPIETALPSSQNYGVYWGPVVGRPADFNVDGVPDLVVANVMASVSYVMLGNGDGTFRLVSQKTWVTLDQYQAIDINGDGHVDLLSADGTVWLGDGTGQFKQAPSNGIAIAGFCTFGKLDGEPHIDMVCGEGAAVGGDIVGGTELLIFHGNGDGTFQLTPIKTITYGDRTNEYNGYGTFETPIAVVDLNGDGIPDIIADAGDGLTVLLGRPGLDFSYPAHYATGYTSITSGVVGPFAMQIADLNGDGLPDLIESGPNGVYITYGRPDGVLDTAPAWELTQVIGYETVADFNEDGIPDIAATGDQAIELSLGKGDGTFEYRTPLPRGNADFSTPLSATNAHIVHGDFNGDHHQDIIAIGSPGIYQYADYILFGHGDGTFTTPALVSNSSTVYPMYSWQQVYDFNHDGKDDLFSSDSSNLYVALSNGDGSFKTVTTALSSDAIAQNLQTRPVIADLNGGGKLDTVIAGKANVLLFKGHGDGSFDASGVKLPIPKYLGVAIQGSLAVAVGDFDGDGHQDIALLATQGYSSQTPANGAVTALFVFFGNGDGTFLAGVPVAGFNRAYTSLYAADLNRDGLDDIVLKTSGSLGNGYAVGIVRSLAGRKFGPEVNYYAGTGLADLAIVDLNHDGFPDLVFGNGDYNIRANSVTVLMNLGNSSAVTGSVYAIPEPSDTASTFQLVASLIAPDRSALAGNVSFSVDGQPAGSAQLVDNQASITVNKVYAAGLHKLRASWPGNNKFAAVSLAGEHQITAGYPTSTSINTNYNPVPFLTSVTFWATVQSTSGTPAGSVALMDGKTHLATVPLSGGAAIYATASLLPGPHSITAEYLPGAGWASSAATLQQQVNPIDATTTLTFSPNTVYALQPVTISATVTARGPVPSGTINFFGDAASLGVKPLSNGKAALSTSFALPGYHWLSAQYSGNQDYNPGYASAPTLNVLVNPTAARLQAAPNPAATAQAVTLTATVSSSTVAHPAPTGTVNFIDNGGPIGSAQLVNGVAVIQLSSLAVGKHPIMASFGGDTSFSPSQSSPVSLVIHQAPSSIALSASPNPAKVNTRVTFTAVVKGPRQPTGSVIFREGSKHLGAAISVDFEGTATFSTTSLSVGAHTIVADYSGDPNLYASTSAPLTVTITK